MASGSDENITNKCNQIKGISEVHHTKNGSKVDNLTKGDENEESEEEERGPEVQAWEMLPNHSKRKRGEVNGESSFDIPPPSPMKSFGLHRGTSLSLITAKPSERWPKMRPC